MSGKNLEDEVREEIKDVFDNLAAEYVKPVLEPGDMTIRRFYEEKKLTEPAARRILEEAVAKGTLEVVIKRHPVHGHLTQVFVEVKR